MNTYLTELNKVRLKIIDRTLIVSTVLMSFALVPSLSRVSDIGWQPVLIVHIGITIATLLLFLARHRVKLEIKTHILLSIYFVIAIVGFINFRIASGSFFILVVVTLGTLILGKRAGILYLAVFLFFAAIVGYLHINGNIYTSIDFNEFTQLYSSWATYMVAYAFVGIVLIDVLNLYYKFFTGYIKDIKSKSDELSEAYKNLKLTEERYRSIFQGSNDGFIFIDKDFRIIDCNKSFLQMIEYSKQEIQYEYLSKVLEDKSICKNYFLLLEKRNNWGEFVEGTLRKNDGNVIPVEITSFTMDDDRIFFWSVIKDLREKKDFEEQIIKTMIRSEEQERERYAKELHDGLGPYLSAALIYVNTIADEENKSLIAEYASKTNQILLEAISTTREISNNLSPHVLTDYGIGQALRSFVEKTKNASSINFTINNFLAGRLPDIVEIAAYRVLTELLNNSIKYSGARNIKIDLHYSSQELKVSFSDDGVGFDYQGMRDKLKGFGLSNIENRIRKLNGKFEYVSLPQQGVKVQFTIKCDFL